MLVNTLRNLKASRRWVWHRPSREHQNQIECSLIKKCFQSSVNISKTQSYPKADISVVQDTNRHTLRMTSPLQHIFAGHHDQHREISYRKCIVEKALTWFVREIKALTQTVFMLFYSWKKVSSYRKHPCPLYNFMLAAIPLQSRNLWQRQFHYEKRGNKQEHVVMCCYLSTAALTGARKAWVHDQGQNLVISTSVSIGGRTITSFHFAP